MKTALIGYSGFVGGNINSQHKFDDLYDIFNINDIKGKEYDLLVCAGVKAQKWYANMHEEEDLKDIFELMNLLKEVTIHKFVLISSVDVYDNPIGVDENSYIDKDKNNAYGRNRYILENYIRDTYQEHLIIRLPALFGKGLKKNFIYDCLTLIPSALNETKWNELKEKANQEEFEIIDSAYSKKDNMYYYGNNNREAVLNVLDKYNMTSLMFSDKRDSFQLFPLSMIWKYMSYALDNGIEVLNITSVPVTCLDIYRVLFNKEFDNTLNREPVSYDMHSIYANDLGGKDGYILDKDTVFKELLKFKEEF